MKNVKSMVRVIAWTREKGQFYDYVKLSLIWEFIHRGYVVALAD